MGPGCRRCDSLVDIVIYPRRSARALVPAYRLWAREDVHDSLTACLGCAMSEFVRFTLDDGSEVMFESAESDLVALRGGPPDIRDGGRLTERLHAVARAAEQIAGSLRSRLAPDEVDLEFGLKVSGEVNWWFFAKSQGEGAIEVTLKWAGHGMTDAPAARPEAGPDPAAR